MKEPVEFVGPVNRQRLEVELLRRSVDPREFSLFGDTTGDTVFVLDHSGHEWSVSFYERGQPRWVEVFPSEDAACRRFADVVLAAEDWDLRNVEPEKFKRSWLRGTFTSTRGFSVRIRPGRTGIEYEDKSGAICVDSEMLAGGRGFALFERSIPATDPPPSQEVLSNITRALQSAKLTVERW